MEPENTVPDADLPTDTEMTLTASLTQAVGEMSLTPDGLEIATLPLNPSSSNTRQCPSSADGNWRAATTSSDRDDNTKPKSSRFQNKVSEVNVDKKPLHFKDQRDIGTFLTEQEVPAPTATKMPLVCFPQYPENGQFIFMAINVLCFLTLLEIDGAQRVEETAPQGRNRSNEWQAFRSQV